jgi:hypothetical protein
MAESVSVWELWDYLKTRLSTERMERLLGGEDRVYKTTEAFSAEGGENEVWGRVVIVPTATLWRAQFAPNETRKVGFLVRGEVHAPPLETSFDPSRLLDAIQREASELLHGHVPPGPFVHMMVALPIYQWSHPQPVPLLDDARGVFYTSSEFRVEVAPATGVL